MTAPLNTPRAEAAAAGPIAMIGTAIAGICTAIDRERRVRATLGHLHRLSDHSLRDIGLSRDQIDQVIRDQSVHW